MRTLTSLSMGAANPCQISSRSCWRISWQATVRLIGRESANQVASYQTTRDAADEPAIEPISVRVPDAVRMTGLSKSKIYQLIATGDIEVAKVGRATVIFTDSLRSFLRSQRKLPRLRP